MRRIVVLLALVMLLAGCTRPADPLGLSNRGNALGGTLAAGDTMSVTWASFRNGTDHDITMLGVRPLMVNEQIPDAPQLVAAFLLDPARISTLFGIGRVGQDVTYPPEAQRALDGAVVRPGEERHLIVELEVTSPGRYAYRGVVVDYLYAGKVYSPLVGLELVLCADQPADCTVPR